MQDKIEWLKRQVKKSLAMVNLVEPEMLEQLIMEGMEDIDSKDEMMIEAYLKVLQELKESTYEKRVEKATSILTPRKASEHNVVKVFSARNEIKDVERVGVRSEKTMNAHLEYLSHDEKLGKDIEDIEKAKQLVSNVFEDMKKHKKNSPSRNEKN
jgi:hypothetical protein